MTVTAALARVRAELEAACRASGSDPAEVHLVAVSKTQPFEKVAEAIAAGQLDLGENYAQELRDKGAAAEAAGLAPRWHFIGRIQRNKAKYIAPRAYRIHTLETVEQAEALVARAPGALHCLVPVNVGDEGSKAGLDPVEVIGRCQALQAVPGIVLTGLMCLPPYRDDPEDVAPFFEELAHLAAQGRAAGLPLHELSMGMSHDFPVAVRHGATWVRVGTAIFGARPGSAPP